jgi:hypothetical protein
MQDVSGCKLGDALNFWICDGSDVVNLSLN